MLNQFHTYGVEYSNHAGDEYIQFYVKNQDGQTQNGPKVTNDVWIWHDFTACNYNYTNEANRCSYLAPFDNPMNVYMVMGVESAALGNDAFVNGVEMEIASVVVYAAS